jgi:hypothetical protein
MDIQGVLQKQRDALNLVLETTIQDTPAIKAYAENFMFVADFEKLLKYLENRGEVKIYEAAINEFQFSLFSSAAGLYRQAYTSLRLFLELSLAGIEYSTNECKLRQWTAGDIDIYWNQLIDADHGILSKQFVRLFAKDLDEQASIYRTIAMRAYRECSEYVHGNSATQSSLPRDLKYSEETVLDWNEKAEIIRNIVFFVLYMRYFHEQDIQKLTEITTVILDTLGHLEEVRQKFGGTIGG